MESEQCILGPLSTGAPGDGPSPAYQGGPCYVGVDVAIRNDLFVLWVVEQVGDVLWTREIIERKRASFAEQEWLEDEVFRRYRVLRACKDQTGLGEMPVERSQRKHGTSRVEGVIFTAANKLALATIAKERFEDRRLRIPEGHPRLRADLHSLKKESGPTGTPRFVVEDEGQASHADRAWACFLSLSAAHNMGGPIEWTPAPSRGSAWDAPAGHRTDTHAEEELRHQLKGGW